MKILIAGDGAKEAAAARLLEKNFHEALVYPGNPASWQFEEESSTEFRAKEYTDLMDAARRMSPDLVLVLDEQYNKSPIKSQLESLGLNVYAPDQKAALNLDDKTRWLEYFNQHGLPAPDYALAESYDEASSLLQQSQSPWVLTEDKNSSRFGVCYSEDEALDLLEEWFDEGVKRVLITEFADGVRFNVPVLVNGSNLCALPSAIIYRGLYEEEDDAQHKGMGAISPASFVKKEDVDFAIQQILQPFFAGLEAMGEPYCGLASGEFVAGDDGVSTVNLKCGLSECGGIVSMLRLESDPIRLIEKVLKGNPAQAKIADQSAVCVVLAGSEFPKAPSIGAPITVDEDFEGYFIPHRTRLENGCLQTNGGRAAMAAHTGKNLQEAREKVMEALKHIHCDDLFYRTDIGKDEQ